VLEAIGESEIGDDDITMFVEKKVFEFEITMYDMLLVKIIDSGNQLSKELLGVSLLEIPTSENVVKQLPA
jgi:hypothetical protein